MSAPKPINNAPQDTDDEYDEDVVASFPPADSNHQLVGSYRRPSIAAGAGSLRPAMVFGSPLPQIYLTRVEREQIAEDEASLLRDNHIIPPKRAIHGLPWQQQEERGRSRARRQSAASATEADALLPDGGDGSASGSTTPTPVDPAKQWEESVLTGKIKTTWQRETKVLARYSGPMIVTFLLQYSLTVASVFSVGRLGKNELAAVSLASMTSNITGYAIYQGLSTSLDTLCAQAYGSGRKKLVGIHLQRCFWFLMVITIPIAITWFCAEWILLLIVPEEELCRLAGNYLRVLIIGAPGYAAFEAGKRYLQAQGIFFAATIVLMICAPLNAVMNYLLVWHPTIGFGFLGAPTAVVITDLLMPLLLALYVIFINGRECWGGLSMKAFKNWGPMIRLAAPGCIMIEAEFLAFEILTLAASFFGTPHLAAQSVLSTFTSLTFQIPFALSIACSTRVANFLGATLGDAAKLSAIVSLWLSVGFGVMNCLFLVSVRHDVGRLFTDDAEIIALVARTMPVCATFQLVDSIAAIGGGILRGQGRQYIGGWVNLFTYYVIALPFSMFSAFYLKWELTGLWAGVSIALALVATIETVVVLRSDWPKMVDQARVRNEMS